MITKKHPPKILIIDNYDSFTFNLVQLLEQCGCINVAIIKNDKIALTHLDLYDKIIISPGPGTPSENKILDDVIKHYYTTKSILGVCLGHQAIAETFGGNLINLKSVYHGIKQKIKIIDKAEYLFDTLPDEFEGGLYHSWAVSDIGFPEELKITSISSNNIIMSISHTKYDLKGIQFHPESILTKYGKKIIYNWINH